MNAVVSHAQQAGETQRGALCVIVRMVYTVRYVSAAEAREDKCPAGDRRGKKVEIKMIKVTKLE